LNKQSQRADKLWSSIWGFVEGLTNPYRKNLPRYETFHKTTDVEEHKLGIFEDMMLTRIFGHMKDGVTGSEEDEKLCDLY
jgi:hypothetical protein